MNWLKRLIEKWKTHCRSIEEWELLINESQDIADEALNTQAALQDALTKAFLEKQTINDNAHFIIGALLMRESADVLISHDLMKIAQESTFNVKYEPTDEGLSLKLDYVEEEE